MSIVSLKLVTAGDGAKLNADKILRAAKGKLQNVTIIGWENESNNLYFASTDGVADTLWMIEKAKQVLLD